MEHEYEIHPINNCASLEEAVERFTDELQGQRDTDIQVHRLVPGYGFPLHCHRATNEWILVHDAEFDFVTSEARKVVRSQGQSVMIYVPAGTPHTIQSRSSPLMYAVVKDRPEDFDIV